MGLTDKGYQRRTYDDILQAKILRAKELLGEDIDTSAQSVLGKYLRINAYDQAIAEEEIEQVYYARFPNTASGQSLDRLLMFAGITRNPASAAVYSVEVIGTASYIIQAGFLVATDTEITYWTTQEYTIGADGTCTVEVSCTEAGTIGNLSSAAAICKPVNPDANVTTVAGKECLKAGVDIESDADLRIRFAAAVEGSGSCNENAIRAAILRVPTVQYAAVISNDTDEEDSEGRPPHSFECYVLGGDYYEQEIATAIFEKRPVGIKTVGEKAVTITDVSGTDRVIYYSPTPQVQITVKAEIKTTNAFPDNGIASVQESIAQYINSLGIGNSLVLSTIYGHIYSVAGVSEVTTLQLSTDGGSTYTTENVAVPKYGVAVCANAHVEVVA
jgi:uncharacterized phage protein gp47/JayE